LEKHQSPGIVQVERKLALSQSAVATPSHFVVHFAGCAGATLPSDEAQLDNKTVPCLANETQADFEERLLSMAPSGRPVLIVMFPRAGEAEMDEVRALHKEGVSGIPNNFSR
jgi:hypothetical protein